jgi:MFS family permease
VSRSWWPSRPAARALARSVVADVTPLRVSPAYRRLWIGLTVSNLGQQMTAVAIAIQVFAITGSSLSVGLVGLFALVPLIGFGLYGGAIADAVDRRRLLLVTSSGLAVMSAVLFGQALMGLRSVGLLYAVVAVQSAFFAVNNPARGAVVPRLLPLGLLPAANALGQVTFNLGYTLGPLLGGAVYGLFGPQAAYGTDLLTFGAALYATWRLPSLPPLGGGHERAGPAMVAEGLRFLRGQRILLMAFAVDLVAMVFGMPRALFPAVAETFYGGGAGTVGLLAAAPAFGALAAALFSGGLSRVRWQGRAVLIAIVVWGAAIAAFGLTRTLVVGMAFLAVAGAADMVSAVFRTTILQVATPDALRGRLQGVFIVVVAGGPRLGDVESGAVAQLFTPTVSIVSGGLLCIAGVLLLAARYPGFARYDAQSPAR